MLCIYHIADHDGKGSAAVVRSVYPETEFLGLNHDMEIPYEEIRKHDKIVVCDIALPLEFMLELSRTTDFVWIDHHASVINEYNEHLANGGAEIKGLRRIGTAACCLTWEYFYPDKELPEGLKLLGLNDIFDLRDSRVRPFEYAVQSIGVNRPGDKIWDDLLNQLTLDEMSRLVGLANSGVIESINMPEYMAFDGWEISVVGKDIEIHHVDDKAIVKEINEKCNQTYHSTKEADFLSVEYGEIPVDLLPITEQIKPIISARIEEMKLCFEAKAYLSSVIMCGVYWKVSFLE